ncbi:MAG: hypothetical protein NTW21_09710 [Verrucomicrobia bacterium]|nr:hypothetical protein [Verrucomicrobiota bacterium]
MAAVAALYAEDQHDLAEAIVASLSRAIFHGNDPQPAGKGKLLLGRVSYRVVRWTTKVIPSRDGNGITLYRNPLFECSGHPYARALLTSSHSEAVALVDGGDAMNGPYMMLSPELRNNGGWWDRIFLDSVQSKDVQMRFMLETQATYNAAIRVLNRGESVRIKAVAAGTGLSLILAYDKLIRDGFDPQSITAVITDRNSANTAKSNRLLAKLASTRNHHHGPGQAYGIVAVAEDVFAGPDPLAVALHAPYNIVTAIGILEYFQGVSHGTTEQRLMLHEPEEPVTARDLVARLAAMTTRRGSLIVNTYRDHSCIRILELLGKRFDFRDRGHLRELLAPLNFRPFHLAGSGHIYDVEVFEKSAAGE